MNFIPREIMYRAWDVDEGTMHYYCSVSSFQGVSSSNGKVNRHDKRSWMTWTGNVYQEGYVQKFIFLQGVIKTDTYETLNGYWIYEGDIVQFDDCDGTEVKGFIVWSEEHNKYSVADKNGFFYPLHSSVKYTVLGNVFENVDLL